MKRIYIKFTAAYIFFLLVQCAWGWSPFKIDNPIYSIIRGEIIKQASSMMDREVYIGSVDGPLIGSVNLKDIRVAKHKKLSDGEIISIKEAKVHYNIFKTAVAKDIIAAISRIEVIAPNIYVEHSRDGSINLEKLVKSGEGEGPPPFKGKVIISNGSARFVDYIGFSPAPIAKKFEMNFSRINGNINLSKKGFVSFKCGALPDGGRIEAEGSVNLKNTKAKIKINAKGLLVKSWNSYIGIPLIKDIDLDGKIDMALITSTPPNPIVEGELSIINGKIYGRPLEGTVNIALKNGKADIKIPEAKICGGSLQGGVLFTSLSNNPALNGEIRFSEVDIKKASLNMPGMRGLGSGTVSMGGGANNIKIVLDGEILNGAVLGLITDKISSAANIKNGDIDIESIDLSYGQNKFTASGKLKKDKNFSFTASARGYKIDNPDLLGGIYGTLENFDGIISGTLDQELFKKPLKNIDLEGKIALTGATIWVQPISSAQGEIKLNKGRLEIKNLSIVNNRSSFEANGSMGFGKKTDIVISGSKIYLEDLNALDELMPEGSRGISGIASINLAIGGGLPLTAPLNFEDLAQDLSASCEVSIKAASAGGQNVEQADLSFLWKNKKLNLKNAYIKTSDSYIALNGIVNPDKTIKASIKSKMNLSALRPFTQKYAKILGLAEIDGEIKGDIINPLFSVNFKLQDAVYNNVRIDKLKGGFRYYKNSYSLFGPVALSQGKDEYAFSSKIDLSKKEPEFEGKVYTSKGGLASASEIIQMVYLEILQRRGTLENLPHRITLKEESFALPQLAYYTAKKGYILYTPDNAFLKAWGKIKQEAENAQQGLNPIKLKAQGRLGLDVELKGKGGNIGVTAAVKVLDAKIGDYKFDNLDALCGFKGGALNVKRFVLNKGAGKFGISGILDFKGPMDLKISSNNLPLDSIDTSINLGVPIKGLITLNAEIKGKYSSPNISGRFAMNNAEVGGIYLDDVEGQVKYAENILNIEKLEVQTGKQKASLKGVIPFKGKKAINVKVNLDGNNIGLLTSLFKGFAWSSGKGKAFISLGGTISKPIIDGNIIIKNAVINLDKIKSTIYDFNADLSAKNNNISIKKFYGTIKGEATLEKPGTFSLAGRIDISDAFGAKKNIYLNIAAADTAGTIRIPGLYSGDIGISKVKMKGALALPGGISAAQKPLLSADINIHDGNVVLPRKGDTSEQGLDIGFDINLDIDKNTRLSQGEAGLPLALEMSSMDLEISGKNIKIGGSLSSPSIIGDIAIKNGTVSVMGRDFELVPDTQQEKFFGLNRAMILKNEAHFYGGAGPAAALPDIFITAQSEVAEAAAATSAASEVPPTDPTTAPAPSAKEKVIILTRITGIPSIQDKERAMKMQLLAFKEDKSKSPPEIVPVPYDENQIRVMLLPDFVKDTLGLSKNKASFDTNAIMVDYLNARLNSFLLKGVTRRVEKALGLESFTLDYNFGKDLEQYLPTNRGEYASSDKPQFGVGFVKGFFDKIFIQLKYAQAMGVQTATSNTSLNYQISWKVNRNYSFVYYREPITYQDSNSTYYKLTLESAYQF